MLDGPKPLVLVDMRGKNPSYFTPTDLNDQNSTEIIHIKSL